MPVEIVNVMASSLIWLRLALQLTGCRKHAETQCTHDNSLLYHSGYQSYFPLINGGGKESSHTTHNGVPIVPRRKNANNSCYIASASENDNEPHQHVARHPRISSQPQNYPDPVLFVHFWSKSFNQPRGPRPKAHWYMCIIEKHDS